MAIARGAARIPRIASARHASIDHACYARTSRMTLADLQLSPWWLRGLAFAWGAVWGSFVNVVVYRVPREMSVVRPGSHCPACGKHIAAARQRPHRVVAAAARARAVLRREDLATLRRARGGGGAHRSRGARDDRAAAAPRDPAAARGHAVPRSLRPGHGAGGGRVHRSRAHVPARRDHHRRHAAWDRHARLAGAGWIDALLGAGIGFVAVWLPFVVGYKALRGRHGMGRGTRSSRCSRGHGSAGRGSCSRSSQAPCTPRWPRSSSSP